MKFFAATLSDNTKFCFKDMSLDSAELYGEWRADKVKLDLVDIKEITEEEMNSNDMVYVGRTVRC